MPLDGSPINVAFSDSLVPKKGPYSEQISVPVATVICLDHNEQQGRHFEAFCLKMIEAYRYGHCSELTIVETGLLKRHYLPFQNPDYSPETPVDHEAMEAEACSLGNNWAKQHQSYINRMSEAGLTVHIWSWKKMCDMETPGYDQSFKDYLEIVQKDLANPKNKPLIFHFNKLVNENAEKAFQASLDRKDRAGKQALSQEAKAALKSACVQAASDYLLEECAAILKLDRCGFAKLLHPMKQNPAMTQIFLIHKDAMCGLKWLDYRVSPQDETKKIHKGKGQASSQRSRGYFFSVPNNSAKQQDEQQEDHCDIREQITALMNRLSVEERGLLLQNLYEHHRTKSCTGPSQTP